MLMTGAAVTGPAYDISELIFGYFIGVEGYRDAGVSQVHFGCDDAFVLLDLIMDEHHTAFSANIYYREDDRLLSQFRSSRDDIDYLLPSSCVCETR